MGDLSVTALYTSAAWAWGKLPNAELLASADAKRVFDATNLVLGATRLVRRRLPSLPHSLVLRHLIIDALLEESGATRVLELAAGLSRRGVTASADPRLSYTEVDRPALVAKKRELLARTPAGREALRRDNLKLVEAELDGGSLAELAPPGGEPLFVIAEGLFMYLDAAAQRALWGRVHELLAPRRGTFVFDLVPTVEQPPPSAFGRALEWTMKRFTGGVSFQRDERTRQDIAAELTALGFAVELLEPSAVRDRFRLPFADVPTQQLLFCCRVL
jgi:O-methyltransferase involved in polyketide biosynthesis